MPQADKHNSYKRIKLNIGLGPITIPKYIDNSQLIVRKSRHQLHIEELHHWAEPLDKNIEHVLHDNLSHLLPHTNVFDYPWSDSEKVKYQIKINVRAFDLNQNGIAILTVNWLLYAEDGQALKKSETRSYRHRINKQKGYQNYASAMSYNLQRLSKDISRTLKRLNKLT